jgi:hypothetical protein
LNGKIVPEVNRQEVVLKIQSNFDVRLRSNVLAQPIFADNATIETDALVGVAERLVHLLPRCGKDCVSYLLTGHNLEIACQATCAAKYVINVTRIRFGWPTRSISRRSFDAPEAGYDPVEGIVGARGRIGSLTIKSQGQPLAREGCGKQPSRIGAPLRSD